MEETKSEEEFPLLEGLESPNFSKKDLKEKSISELYQMVKMSPKIMEDIKNIGKETIEKFISERYKVEEEKEIDSETQIKLYESYRCIQDLIRKYCDLHEGYYTIIPLWIIGTYVHEQFSTYPFLYLNAMRGSGKTRLLKLISSLSKGGDMLNSLTEAVLFRTKGMLAIDEFEGITRKGSENLRELLNSSYKKGVKVKRMKRVKTLTGEEQQVEEFDVYRPICMANIWGMEEVLSDRCITLILERSSKSHVVLLVEIFEKEKYHKIATQLLNELFCVNFKNPVVNVMSFTRGEDYEDWNIYIYNDITTGAQNISKRQPLFEAIKNMGLDGRSLELCFPLILIAEKLGSKILKETIQILSEIMKEKKEDFSLESKDISFVQFISELPTPTYFIPLQILTKDFKIFLNEDETEDKWINTKWMGRALKRLNLIKEKKRLERGREVLLDIEKAREKIRMFK